MTGWKESLLERFARLLIKGLQKLPLGLVRALGRGIGNLGYVICGKRRQIALDNLDLAYGDTLSVQEKKRIARASFVNLVTTGFEFCYFPKLVNRPLEETVKRVNHHYMTEAVAAGNGVICLVLHMGNWEVAGSSYRGLPITPYAVVRHQKQAWVTRLITEIRQQYGIVEIHKRDALKKVLTVLRQGGVVNLLIDQHAAEESVEVQFFGKPAMTTASAALFALRTNSKVMIACCTRDEKMDLVLTCYPPFETVRTGDFKQDLVTNTQIYVDGIEQAVRQQPESWMWVHRRWRLPAR